MYNSLILNIFLSEHFIWQNVTSVKREIELIIKKNDNIFVNLENKKKIKIVIADDHPFLLRGIKHSLNGFERFEVVGEATEGDKALELILELKPQCAILDYNMPKLNGLQIAKEIAKQKLDTKIVFLTFHRETNIIKEAFSAGVLGYVSKDNQEDELARCIDAVCEGQKFISQNLALYLVTPDLHEKNGQLTKIEQLVLKKVAENKTTREIADELFISYKTVEGHRSNICKKFNITGNNALVRYVLENKENILLDDIL